MKNSKEKGITLLALVITIIILLILAGVTIGMATSGTGLFSKAKEATESYKIESIKEEISLSITNEYLDSQIENREFDYDNVWNELRKNDENLQVERNDDEDCYYITYKGYKFKIEANLNVIYVGEGDGTSTYTVTYNANGGSGTMSSSSGKSITIKNNEFTPKTGRLFKEWNTKSNGKGMTYEPGTTVSANLTLYAIYYKTTYELGEEIEYDGEKYYVLYGMEENLNEVTIISKYNLNKTGTAQAANADNNVTSSAFSSTNYWSTEWNLYTNWQTEKLNLNNINKESSGDAISKAKTYATSKGGEGRLLTYEEADDFINYSTDMANIIYGSYNIKTTQPGLCYWLGSALSDASNKVYWVTGGGQDIYEYVYSTDENAGVRPVIKIAKSKIKEITYTVSYDANGGTGNMNNATDSELRAVACEFAPLTERKFRNWNTTADGTGTTYKVGDKVTEDATLYAQWYRTKYDLGEEIEVKGEKFYVLYGMEESSDDLTIISKYNLNKTGTAQVANADNSTTSCVFSSTNYWSTEWNSYTNWQTEKLNLNNINKESSGDAISKAKNYATSKGGAGRLLTYEEADNFINYSTDMASIIYGSYNIKATGTGLCYWLGSALSDASNKVYWVTGGGQDIYSYVHSTDENAGVRPVIQISKSKV